MKPVWIATSVVSILLVASLAGVAMFVGFEENAPVAEHAMQEHAGADHSMLTKGIAGDHDHDGDGHPDTGMERPAFPVAEGSVPTADEARELEQIRSIRIIGDDEATPAVGIRSGSGTLTDSYVISGFYVTGDLYIQDTDACFEIKDNFIGGQLSLNWNGQCVFVHHNFIRDLRVNENIRREGFATGGLLEMNKIEFVGQLRHYDGEFRHNVVGPKGPGSMWDTVLETVPFLFIDDPRVANVDGFNQGLIHHNTFEGSVDLDFHGHHHGTGFFSPHSHYHGDAMDKGMEHDHTDRSTSVFFSDNKIIDPEGYGLRYEDQNHAGDDRMANSEQEETLKMPHKHHLLVEITGNEIIGAPLWVDIFMADDRNHETRNEGYLTIVGNTIELQEREDDSLLPFWGDGHVYTSAIRVYAAKEVEMLIQDNTMTWVPLEDKQEPLLGNWFRYEGVPTAIDLFQVRDANIVVSENRGDGFEIGVSGLRFDERTTWTVTDNEFVGAAQELYYDDSVSNRPSE